MKSKPKFTQVFSKVPAINWLSASRFFLFGSRDVWFVVALPVFLVEVTGWSITAVGTFMAFWVIGYGFVQALAPKLISRSHHGQGPGAGAARLWAFILALFPAGIVLAMQQGWPTETVLVSGLILFGIAFAINSAVHSYLILAYSDHDKVSMNVGFYYMANAGGRLAGTVLSGLVYQMQGLEACLWLSSGFVLIAALLSFGLPQLQETN
jgi:predicted MFS family arabinose efflux permease